LAQGVVGLAVVVETPPDPLDVSGTPAFRL
jgi:hypothetical protein